MKLLITGSLNDEPSSFNISKKGINAAKLIISKIAEKNESIIIEANWILLRFVNFFIKKNNSLIIPLDLSCMNTCLF